MKTNEAIDNDMDGDDDDFDYDFEWSEFKLDGLSLLFGQAYFKRQFYGDNPQCKGCKNIDLLVMDYQIYPAYKKRHCLTCDKYKGW